MSIIGTLNALYEEIESAETNGNTELANELKNKCNEFLNGRGKLKTKNLKPNSKRSKDGRYR